LTDEDLLRMHVAARPLRTLDIVALAVKPDAAASRKVALDTSGDSGPPSNMFPALARVLTFGADVGERDSFMVI
jgi:hypothetical protein